MSLNFLMRKGNLSKVASNLNKFEQKLKASLSACWHCNFVPQMLRLFGAAWNSLKLGILPSDFDAYNF